MGHSPAVLWGKWLLLQTGWFPAVSSLEFRPPRLHVYISGKSIPKFFLKQIPGCWGGHHHPSNENGLPSQPLLGPGCLWSSRQWRLANGTCSSASAGRMMVTWVSQSWNPPKILVLISEVKQPYTISFYFLYSRLETRLWRYKKSSLFSPMFFSTRRWFSEFFWSQDLVTKLRETAKASLGRSCYHFGWRWSGWVL